MDLNELLHAHQLAVMKASGAGDVDVKAGHDADVARYAREVGALRAVHNRSGESTGANTAGAIIYGTYAGNDVVREPPLHSWEDEGGSLDPALVESAPLSLPDGMTSEIVRQYRVGPYVYQDLGLALAEHLRQLSDTSSESDANDPLDRVSETL